MTMLAMWLDEKSVALATDCKTTDNEDPVKKLYRLPSGKVMFGIGFHGEAHAWLTKCCICSDCAQYTGHWKNCSKANSTEDLEQSIRRDLRGGRFPKYSELRVCVAGFNAQGSLEAFVMNENGDREKNLPRGKPWFNGPCKSVELNRCQSWPPQLRFPVRQKELEKQGVEFSGVETLREICKELVDCCNGIEGSTIGLALDFCYGSLASGILFDVEHHEI